MVSDDEMESPRRRNAPRGRSSRGNGSFLSPLPGRDSIEAETALQGYDSAKSPPVHIDGFIARFLSAAIPAYGAVFDASRRQRYVVYIIEVSVHGGSGFSWKIYRRYSDFIALRKALIANARKKTRTSRRRKTSDGASLHSNVSTWRSRSMSDNAIPDALSESTPANKSVPLSQKSITFR